jgi:hypothetical protein
MKMERDELIEMIRQELDAKLDIDSLEPLVYKLHGTRVVGHDEDERSVYATIGPNNDVRLHVFASHQAARDALGHTAQRTLEKLEAVFVLANAEYLKQLLEVVSDAGPITGINFEFGGE